MRASDPLCHLFSELHVLPFASLIRVTSPQAIPACICMALSVTYHTFMNCVCCYRRLLIADVMGIWVTMFFGFSTFYLQSCILPNAAVLKAAYMYRPFLPFPCVSAITV